MSVGLSLKIQMALLLPNKSYNVRHEVGKLTFSSDVLTARIVATMLDLAESTFSPGA